MSTDAIVTVAAPGLDAKREAAKEYLGANWVNHPAYRYNPRHSTNQETYVPARQPYLLSIAVLARVDRQQNPAFARAEAIRHTFSNQ